MAKQGGKFGRKQEEAIVALLAQPGIDAAARAIGVATRTLLRWHRNAEFRAKYLQARRDVHSQATARLQQATTAAATTMLKLMVDQTVPASVRLRASEAVYDRSIKAIELEDVEARVAALEQAAEQAKGSIDY
jgi:transposase-like protein